MRLKQSVPDTLAWIPMLIGVLAAAYVVGATGSLIGKLVGGAIFVCLVAFGMYIMDPSGG